MKIPEGIADYTGLTEEAISAKVDELMKADTESDFTDEMREIEVIAVPLFGDKPSTVSLPAQMQFVGVNEAFAVFLRAGRSQSEKEAAAMQTAINELMKVQDETVKNTSYVPPTGTGITDQTLDETDAAVDALEEENGN